MHRFTVDNSKFARTLSSPVTETTEGVPDNSGSWESCVASDSIGLFLRSFGETPESGFAF